MKISEDSAFLFCDGACSGNPGPGGWGTIVFAPESGVMELGGARAKTTNNQMELMACIEGLKVIRTANPQIDVYTDSTYLIRGITQWVWGWQKRSWKTAEGAEVLNQDLWQELLSLTKIRLKDKKLKWHYVRGHTGIPGNERCDQIAVAFREGERLRLYQGALTSYPLDILSIPEDTSLPPFKPQGSAKAVPFSYLSYVDGHLERHQTWAECEKRVKGHKGARFKKALNLEDEEQILSSWGLSRKNR